MRVLFTTVPGPAFYLPMIPVAWALRSAGHEVLVVNNGPGASVTAEGGIPVVDPCPDVDVWGEFASTVAASGAKRAAEPGAVLRPTDEASRSVLIQRIGKRFATFGRSMGPGALRIARSFRPDLVVSTLEQWAGAMVAGELGTPYVEQSVRLSRGKLDEKGDRIREAASAEFDDETRRQLGFSRPAASPVATLDVRPPSIAGPGSDDRWSMRHVPYNANIVLPEWVFAEAERPRVCLTLGSVLPTIGGLAGLRDLLAELRTLDVEVVLALGDVDLSELGELPGNVRSGGWMPLSAVLPRCAALVHHGGAGTCLTAMAYGVPQLVLPHYADQPMNADLVAAGGFGVALPATDATPEAVRSALERLISEPTFAKQAAEVGAEIAEMPSPADLVPRFESVVRLS